jgi:hypothetical protein
MAARAKTSWADSKDAWLSRVHDAELPSGIKVTYRDLSLAELAVLGELPADLLEIAIAEWSEPGVAVARLARAPLEQLPDKPTAEQQAAAEAHVQDIFRRLARINRHLVAAALVQPKLTLEELEQVPVPDLEMLSELVNRTRTIDAAGRHVGVVPIDQFRVVLDAHRVEQCPPGCEACETARRGLSTIR